MFLGREGLPNASLYKGDRRRGLLMDCLITAILTICHCKPVKRLFDPYTLARKRAKAGSAAGKILVRGI